MSEWLKEHAWKACVGETLPWVRIPLSPPASYRCGHLRIISRSKVPAATRNDPRDRIAARMADLRVRQGAVPHDESRAAVHRPGGQARKDAGPACFIRDVPDARSSA